jgi:hypothetical protein
VKISAAFCFSNKVNVIEYYHNSSWLEHGGSPEKAARSGFVYAIDAYIKKIGKYQKNESKITFQDVQDCLVLVTNCFSTQTSYENQTKKAITNKFIQDAMTDFFREQLEVYFIENKPEADRIAEQVLINKRSRETAEKARQGMKKKLTGSIDIANRVQKFVDCRSRDTGVREIYIVEGDSALGACKQSRNAEFPGLMPVRGKILNCLKADFVRIFKSEIITDLIKVLGCGVEVRRQAHQGPCGLRRQQSALEQGHYLHRRRCGRLPDTHAHPHHALPSGAHADQGGLRLYRRVPAVTRSSAREKPGLPIQTGRKRDSRGLRRRRNAPFNRSKGLGENDPGHDVDDHHEPGDPPADQSDAGGSGQNIHVF